MTHTKYASSAYRQGFWDTLGRFGVHPSQFLAKRTLPPAHETYISAATPKPKPHAVVRADPRVQFRAPSWSPEAQLSSAGETAIKAVPAVLSTPAAAAMGGLSGMASGIRAGDDSLGVAARGILGAGTAFIPGTTGLINSATGAIESTVGQAIDGLAE